MTPSRIKSTVEFVIISSRSRIYADKWIFLEENNMVDTRNGKSIVFSLMYN